MRFLQGYSKNHTLVDLYSPTIDVDLVVNIMLNINTYGTYG